ncbi:C-terminal binding protein [Leucobacter sp. W1478]|uniref:C-terminal binding protein n=1 Tax=Leucobacter sp. W1478 TaxID=3439065 RepID=UPI003F3003FD
MSTSFEHPSGAPVAVYTDIDDTDVSGGIALLEAAGFTVRIAGSRDATQIAAVAHDAEALLVGYATVDAELIAALPRLRIIAVMSMGYNNIDLDAARARGIWVCNVPGAATEEVATHALALALHAERELSFYLGSATPDDWNSRAAVAPRRLSELTLGVVGLGKIGQALASVAAPLFGQIVGYDPLLPDTAETAQSLAQLGVERTSLEEVRRRADVLSLHVPLTPETDSMINAAFIAQMPPQASIINMSRGALIDEPALRDALDSGRIRWAALDVLSTEPPQPGHPLVGHPRVTLTPHIAYFSNRTDAEYVRIQAQNVASWLITGTPETHVLAPTTS